MTVLRKRLGNFDMALDDGELRRMCTPRLGAAGRRP